MAELLITNIQRFSVHDGPGIRTTVFFKGCPLRCLWCHNPETFEYRPQLRFIAPKCKGCGVCEQVCPHGAASPKGVDREKCVLCAACVEACPFSAREIAGEKREAADVLAEVLKDRAYYEKTGGGITLSGGEPLMQPDGAEELLRLAREHGISTAVESSLCVPETVIKRIAPLVDLFMCDLKACDGELHRRLTGRDNAQIKENMRLLVQLGKKMLIRIPVVPLLNDGEEMLQDSADFIASLGAECEVELLAYHALGRDKYRSLDMPYPAEEIVPPTAEQMEGYRDIFRNKGIKVK